MQVGAAVGTGDGDVMMRFLLSFRAVELMKEGKNATEACRISLRSVRQVNFVFLFSYLVQRIC